MSRSFITAVQRYYPYETNADDGLELIHNCHIAGVV